jgi:soluble lytic murein transglycosylase-like protein
MNNKCTNFMPELLAHKNCCTQCIKLKIIMLTLIFIFLPGLLLAKNVTLPITIDYPLLRSIVMSQLFNSPEKEVELLNDPKECKKIVISDPYFSEENSLLRFEIKVRIKAGAEFMDDCYLPVEWEGYVVFFQTPVIEAENWILSFKTRDSLVLNNKHEPGIISGAVWKLIKGNVHTYVDTIQIDLTPCVNDIKFFLTGIFPERQQPQAETMTASMKPGNIEIQNNAVQIGIHTDVSSVYDSARSLKEEHLNDVELAGFIQAWEAMDAFIVYVISSLTDRPLNEDEKDIILEILLDTRYRFIAELARPVHENDFVRNQFIIAWDNLSVLFKNHIGKNLTISPLGSLAFFSSMDALKVLDSIGPSLGIEISNNGLIRLARLIADKKTPDLFYSLEIDENLRQIMGLGPKLKESSDLIPDERKDYKEDFLNNIIKNLISLLNRTSIFINPYSEAIAAEQKKTDTIHLEKWLPNQPNIFEYLKHIGQILKKASEKTVSKNKRDQEYQDLFYLIVDAVAWQESCFRQFKLNRGEIEYLRSYNNTSVGVMQINERVWRGIYDQEKLRWNIHYNIEAGCEIIDLYLTRYIFRKMEKKKYKYLENKDNIARTLYALYNGGPGEFSKFLKRSSEEKFYLSDDLFYEKYLWVKNNQLEKASICLVGK